MKKSSALLGSIVVVIAFYLLGPRGGSSGDVPKSRSKDEGFSESGNWNLGRHSFIEEAKSTKSRLEGRAKGDFKSVLPHGYSISARNMSERRAEGDAVLATPNGLVLSCGEISISNDNTSIFLIGDIAQDYPDQDFVRVHSRAVMKLKLSDQSSKMTSSGWKKIPKEKAEQGVPPKSDSAGG